MNFNNVIIIAYSFSGNLNYISTYAFRKKHYFSWKIEYELRKYRIVEMVLI